MSDWTPTTEQVRDGYRYDAEYEYHNPLSTEHVRLGRAFDRWLAAHDAQVRAEERERIAQAIVDELARTTATARPEACEYADEGYCHTEAREQALEDAARIARASGDD